MKNFELKVIVCEHPNSQITEFYYEGSALMNVSVTPMEHWEITQIDLDKQTVELVQLHTTETKTWHTSIEVFKTLRQNEELLPYPRIAVEFDKMIRRSDYEDYRFAG